MIRRNTIAAVLPLLVRSAAMLSLAALAGMPAAVAGANPVAAAPSAQTRVATASRPDVR
jgi:hypothetical protein